MIFCFLSKDGSVVSSLVPRRQQCLHDPHHHPLLLAQDLRHRGLFLRHILLLDSLSFSADIDIQT